MPILVKSDDVSSGKKAKVSSWVVTGGTGVHGLIFTQCKGGLFENVGP